MTGEPIWTLFTAFAVSDASGELVALATVSRDVTEERGARLGPSPRARGGSLPSWRS